MSSLIFATDEKQILVATDTLSVTPKGKPLAFVQKATHIPHLRTIIAGTGFNGFANHWALIASTRMRVKGIMNLDYHTPIGLRRLWSDYKKEYDIPNDFTTTVYQLGISEENGKVVSFAYRSTNNFESESIGYGICVKPNCTVPKGNLIDVLPEMMEEQRIIQKQMPSESRVYIGGEIQVLHLTMQGCDSFIISKFSDFSETEAEILNNHAF